MVAILARATTPSVVAGYSTFAKSWHRAARGGILPTTCQRYHRSRPRHSGKAHRYKRLLHSIASRQGRIRVSARTAAWIEHTSCTHRIAECRDRSRIVGRKRYSGRCLYRLYQDPRGCQAGSWSRSHWCSKTKAMPDRQRQGFFSRVPKKLSKQGFPQLRDYNTLAKSWHRAPHGSFMLCASFFGHSAVSSSSQSMTLASRPRLSNETGRT